MSGTCPQTCLERRAKVLKISDFAKSRNVNYDTVRRYIKRNPDIFKDHIGKANNIELDDEALKILDEKYPLPSPVEVIQDTERVNHLMERLADLQEKLIFALEQNALLQQENAELRLIQYKQELLEDDLHGKEKELSYLREEKESWIKTFKSDEEEIRDLESRLEGAREKERQLEEELKKEKEKTWWDKLRGR